ncbi:MAG TPA: ferredoxin [archaeon]|nr:ferredoxin [archaeon]
MVHVSVNDECIGCGACAAIAPRLFEIDGSTMKSKVKKQPTSEEEVELARQAADACPVASITVK